jgi:DNA polymerase III epsilon subunit-like protein
MNDKDAKGKLKKLRKRALNGEINTIENYKQCIASGIPGTIKFQITIDKTRKDAHHNLNITEIRDILLGIILGRQLPRCIEIKNKCFIRNIFLLHFNNSADPKKSLLTINDASTSAETYSVRISKNDVEDVISLPFKLLTISNDQIDDIIGNKMKKPKLQQDQINVNEDVSVDDGEELDLNDVLEKYILSKGQMKAWNYPIKIDDENLNKVDQALQKMVAERLKIEKPDCYNGLMKGNLPSISESCELLLELIKNNESFTVTDGDTTCKGYLQTYPKSSEIYSKLCSLIVAPEADADADENSRSNNDIDENYGEESDGQYSIDDKDEGTLELDIIAVDCEMCDTANGMEITRLTLVDHDCKVLLDTYIQPDNPITNHRTQWSGITEEKIKNVTVTLFQAQLAFMRIVSADTILVGHSLENDLRALKMIHNRCCDTAIMYPHSQGYPLRRKLKSIAEEYLGLTIQSSDKGHNSVEDAAAAMELAILKMENGPEFGLPKNSFIPTRTSILPLLESTNKLSNVSLYLDSNENLKLNENLHNPTGQNRIKIMNYNNFDELRSQYLLNKSSINNDGINLTYISINSVDESAKNIIDLLNQLELTTSSLVIATSQCSLNDVKLLEEQKKTCLKNRQSTISWSKNEEEKLKNRRLQSNIGYMTYKILENY